MSDDTVTTYTRAALTGESDSGTCPRCLRRIRTRTSGRMHRHGWTETGRGSGWSQILTPYCPGTDHRPIEETDGDARGFIVGLALDIGRIKKRADDLEDGTTKTLLISTSINGPWRRDGEKYAENPGGIPGVTPKNAEHFERAFALIQLAQAGALVHNGIKLGRVVETPMTGHRKERTVYTLNWEIGEKFTALAPAEAEIFQLPSWRELVAIQRKEWLDRVRAIADQIALIGDACEKELHFACAVVKELSQAQ